MLGRSLTPFTMTVLDCIEEFYKSKGYSPTYREISDLMGGGSTSAISYAMDTLVERGFLTEGVPGQSRTQVPTYKNREEGEEENEPQ